MCRDIEETFEDKRSYLKSSEEMIDRRKSIKAHSEELRLLFMHFRDLMELSTGRAVQSLMFSPLTNLNQIVKLFNYNTTKRYQLSLIGQENIPLILKGEESIFSFVIYKLIMSAVYRTEHSGAD